MGPFDCRYQSDLVQLAQTVQVYCDHGLQWSIQKFAYLTGIFSLDVLYLVGKSPLLMRNIQFNFGDIEPKTSKISAFWDMGVNSNLKWLPFFSLDEAGELDSTSLPACAKGPGGLVGKTTSKTASS